MSTSELGSYINISEMQWTLIKNIQQSLYVLEAWCSGFWFSMTIHCNFNVSTLCEQFWQIRMRPCGWRVSIPQCPAIAQIALSPVQLCLSCFMEQDSPSIILCLNMCCILLKTNLQVFYAFRVILYFYYCYVISS